MKNIMNKKSHIFHLGELNLKEKIIHVSSESFEIDRFDRIRNLERFNFTIHE